MSNVIFEAGQYSKQIDECISKVGQIYLENKFIEENDLLLEDIKKVSENDRIKVVFIGQYSAGKSSIISALTNNKDIKIDADIATSEAADYSWGAVNLTDTPGLYTENTEHDERTKEAIKVSDLMVYCITSDLFNQYTLDDFKRLAYDMKFKDKMFLVINKMSKEAGEYDELTKNYTITLNKSLDSHNIDEFEHCFIDAKDYREGVEDNDKELIEYSKFEILINKLNDFIKRKGQLGKLDTPIVVIKNSIDNVLLKLVEDGKNKNYLIVLNRMSKRVSAQRHKAKNDAYSIMRAELNRIVDKGYEISQKIGVEEVDFSENDLNELIEDVCNNINVQLQESVEENINELNEQVKDVLESEPAQHFMNDVEASSKGGFNIFKSKEKKNSKIQFDALNDIVSKISNGTVKLATNGASKGANVLFKSTDAAGSTVHKSVTAIGKKLGVKFKPWQAVNISKNIANVAEMAGPALAVFSFIYDVKKTIDEEARLNKIKTAQYEYKQSFINIRDELEKQYSDEVNNYLNVFTETCEMIDKEINNISNDKKNKSEASMELQKQKEILSSIQDKIYKR
ncbi:GTPase [Clostridium saccharobutylicum]|uniref:GTPase domain-containing protein n=1 Tax=Clostridium saccharobutylicum DSM 13864 TaxID=1345695 RepID=U5MN37_CLOSA|nr:GTPase [Clostridium saccharobutylicum]AGX41903.1 GTPase domain-containing protein [Clostridium saccharobutylicum DSM 13864]AQR89181.1 GTPase of unknown function [Clostridium saccharobutylicum]AQR99082.1 GTPase of unknown function [Clostridium saccharobutylicum]AQS08804.1 GTPase of unknown function [Clostridium saccharobutylicum]AQS13070.1 GTPase of unknown function [Clostridium saccharobutylicum]